MTGAALPFVFLTYTHTRTDRTPTMSIASPAPTPREVFGADALRAVKVYEEAVTSVLEQCKDRLRRGVAAQSVTVLLRNQYALRLAPLAAGVEILQDAVLDERFVTEQPVPETKGGAVRVDAGAVRYAPFGNAAPRAASRKKARA